MKKDKGIGLRISQGWAVDDILNLAKESISSCCISNEDDIYELRSDLLEHLKAIDNIRKTKSKKELTAFMKLYMMGST